ncbi:MAG: gliding motility-associated C-terminal domain-containing protein [Bacteroidetes bacterium]|nr:gliding motility-associated C-terminal domain-containing protein [Bacteroidota bacterium]
MLSGLPILYLVMSIAASFHPRKDKFRLEYPTLLVISPSNNRISGEWPIGDYQEIDTLTSQFQKEIEYKMIKAIYALGLMLTSYGVFAQSLVTNNGANIYVKDGGFIIVKTGSVSNNTVGGQGLIDNLGTITVEGSVTNSATINGSGDTIRLFGDWVNNAAYTGSNSWVDMFGGDQQITGTAITTFDNLNLGGGNVVKKQTINAVTTKILALNSAELATNANEMLVSNPATAAITRNVGFVSSVGNGKLSRATNTTAAYLFPTGSPSYVGAPSIFRPIDFTPAAAGNNTYGARLVKGDATTDGYSVFSVDDQLCAVNPNFYHWLYQSSGTDAAALTMYFNPATDASWTDAAHWDAPNRWNYLGTPAGGSGLGMSTITVSGANDFTPQPFALAKRKFLLDAGNPISIPAGQSTTLNPVIGTPSFTSIVWSPPATLTCSDCQNPVATPPATTYYTITVTDDAGCVVSDSVLVTIIAEQLLIPTAFSPNGDGMNDIFRSKNDNLSKFNLQVYNRWGEKVFETDNVSDGWDGTFRTVAQGLGVYAWQCQYQFAGTTKIITAKGNVTLLR